MDDLSLKLQTPVKDADGSTISVLTMRELKVDELIILDRQSTGKTDLEREKAHFVMVCGVSPDVIGSLTHRDWRRLNTRYWLTLGNVEPEPET